MDSSVSPKDEIWFLRVCHHISNAVLTNAICQTLRRKGVAGEGGGASGAAAPGTRIQGAEKWNEKKIYIYIFLGVPF
jgi:hypothetical protein